MAASSENRRDAIQWFRSTLPAALIILISVALAYSNTFSVPFLFDDLEDIGKNEAIRRLWPIWRVFIAESDEGSGVHNRPAVVLSFALNYAVGGMEPFSYHVVNVAIHVIAALTLLGIVRRTLLLPGMERFSHVAAVLDLGIALLWALHPLQTQAITYIVQRYESMMGMFYLLTLYCVIRAATSVRPQPWTIASVVCCILALASKEVAVSLPIVVLLYDRAFLAGSFRKAVERRTVLYLGFIAAWALFFLWQQFTPAKNWAGDGTGIEWHEYFLSQPGVILHYLRLCFWPTGQCLDYAWPIARSTGAILPQTIAITLLGSATFWALARHPRWGFLGAWFFLILAPTSSILPIADLAFEHRMYLPLAAVVTATVFGSLCCFPRTATPLPTVWSVTLATTLCAAVILGIVSFIRNRAYETPRAMWSDIVAKRPENLRGRLGYALALETEGNTQLAVEEYRRALAIDPNHVDSLYNLGTLHIKRGEAAEAVPLFRGLVARLPNDPKIVNNFAAALSRVGDLDEAIRQFRRALELDPDFRPAREGLARASRAREKLLGRPSAGAAESNTGR